MSDVAHESTCVVPFFTAYGGVGVSDDGEGDDLVYVGDDWKVLQAGFDEYVARGHCVEYDA